MKRTSVLLIAGLVVATCTQAQTQSPAPPPSGWEAAKAVGGACKSETPQLCPGLSATDYNKILACLQTNIDKLTPGCKDAVVKAAKAALPF
jgi:hypothetical protein